MPALILFGLFIGIPILEIALFIQIGSLIGILPTLGIVILTAFLGTVLLRQQGLSVLNQARRDLEAQRPPIASVADGALLLIAGAFLLTPGFFTDAVGFSLMVPGVRALIRNQITEWIKKNVTVVTADGMGPRQDPRSDGFETKHPSSHAQRKGPTVIDGEAEDISDQPVGDPDPNSPWHNTPPKR